MQGLSSAISIKDVTQNWRKNLVQRPERWALIHLTRKGAPETPPRPKTEFYGTIHTLVQALQETA